MSLTDKYESLKNYNHPDNWMSSEEAEHITNMEALEKEEREWEQRQKDLDDHYSSYRG